EVAGGLGSCAVAGHTARGLGLAGRPLRGRGVPPAPLAGMRFATRAALLLRGAAAEGRGAVGLHRLDHGTRPAGDVTVAALAEDLAARAEHLAGCFDIRNGTGYQGAQVRRVLEAPSIVGALPLVPPVAAGPPPKPRPAVPLELPTGIGPD